LSLTYSCASSKRRTSEMSPEAAAAAAADDFIADSGVACHKKDRFPAQDVVEGVGDVELGEL
jgi:hypothetical protein